MDAAQGGLQAKRRRIAGKRLAKEGASYDFCRLVSFYLKGMFSSFSSHFAEVLRIFG